MSDFKSEVRRRIVRLNLPAAREAAIVEEMVQHLEQRYNELVAKGESPERAREALLRDLKESTNLEHELLRTEHTEQYEAALPSRPGLTQILARLGRDFRYSLRGLRKSPGFALVAILSLALGIGANTAIFQLLDSVSMRTLPVQDPGQLTLIRTPNAPGRSGRVNGRAPILSYPVWEEIRDHQQVFSGLATWHDSTFNLASGGKVRNAHALYVNGDFFRTLGINPILGRVFSESDDYKGCGLSGIVISYGFWQRQFGGRDSAVGSKLTVEGHAGQVIGVTPPGFYGVEVGRSFDLAVPLCSEKLIAGEDEMIDRRDAWWLATIGRLRPGITPQKATAQLESISPGVFQATLPAVYRPEYAKEYLGWKLAADPISTGVSSLRGTYEQPLWILLAIAGTVLLIACANLANLMFARASAHEREIAVRLALGASRSRLLQQFLMESLLIATIGAAAGVALAQLLSRVLISFLATQFGGVTLDLVLDWRVLGFTAAVAIATCLFFGLMPAVRATATPPMAAMKAGGRGVTGRHGRFSVRRLLVVAQMALSMALLAGAFLFVGSLRNLLQVDAGFREDGILEVDVDFSALHTPSAQRNAFRQQLADRLQSLPGVVSASTVNVVPLSGYGWNERLSADLNSADYAESANFNRVNPVFFRTLNTALVKGRDFNQDDTVDSPMVAIVNQAFVHTIFKDAEPLGRTFRVDQGTGVAPWICQVVGVVKDTKYYDLREAFRPIVYLPLAQDKAPEDFVSILLHSSVPPESLENSIEHAMTNVSPAISVQFTLFKRQIRDTLRRDRLMASLSGFFGFLAGLLACIGLYGVISYMVSRRRNEIGIRIALGADRVRVLSLVMREAAVLLGIGLIVGVKISLVATRAVSSLLYGLRPADPVMLGSAAIVLAAVAAAASYLPAFRAARIHPTEALREE